jgi:subtilisin-like proprotein convertase family protein
MKLRYTLLLLAAGMLCLAGNALAQKQQGGNTQPTSGPNCDLTGYKSSYQVFPTPIPIPDNSAAGIVVGSIDQPADGTLFDDVILDVQMSHTWLGDLILTLAYFQDCASASPVASVRVLCRQRGTNANAPVPCGSDASGFGCNGDLSCNNVYYFSDDALAPMGEGVCAAAIAAGCYKPATGNSMAVFRGLAKGGCFRLSVSDNAAADVGTVCSWSIHTRNTGPVDALTNTWGKLKAIYR